VSTSTPPPRPSQLRDRPPVPQPTPRREVSITVRLNRTLMLGILLGMLIMGMIAWAFIQVTDDTARIADRVATGYSQSGVPRCTDAIADAGGICYGEPLPPCPTEDSVGCYWDAQTMGNGTGRSYTVEPNGTVSYVP